MASALYEGAGTGQVSFPMDVLRSVLQLANMITRQKEMTYRLKVLSLFEVATSGNTLVAKDLEQLRNYDLLQREWLGDEVQGEWSPACVSRRRLTSSCNQHRIASGLVAVARRTVAAECQTEGPTLPISTLFLSECC